ncbi:hypothetical protein BASA83_005331 [Batrachochytrium salamandrivorans]|nr:hypothetical protein BASA83_005331 [Batrachochytrium salamandrivorans]
MSKEYIKEAVMEYTQKDDTARLPAYAHAHAHAHAHNNAHNNACHHPLEITLTNFFINVESQKSTQPARQETYNQVETFPQSDQPNQPLDRPIKCKLHTVVRQQKLGHLHQQLIDTLVSEAPILDASDDIEKHPSPISRTKSPQPPLHSKEVNVAHKATSLDIPITLVETRNSLDLAEFGLLKTKLSETIRLHEEQTQQWEDEISDMKADLDAAEATRILLEQRLKDADQKLSATSDSNSTAHSKMLSNDPSDGTPAHVSSSTEILHAVGANAQETEGWGDENGWGEFKDDPAMENYSNNYVGENDPDSHHSPSSKDRFDSESRINALQVQLQDAIEARDNLQTIISTHEASRASFVNMNIEEIDELRAERDRLLEQLEVACLQYTNFERESEAHKAKMEINLEALKDTHEIALLEGTQHRASLEKELEDAYEKLNAVHLQLQESTLALNDIREQNKEKSLQEKTIFESSDSTQEHESIVAQLNLQISDLKDHLESLTVSSKAREDEITGRLATVKALAAEKIKRLMSENQRLSSTMTDPTASTTFRKGSPTLNSAVSPVSEVDAAAFTALQQSFEETQEQHSIQLQRATLLSTQIEAEQARSSQLQSSIHSLQELGEKDGQHIKALQATISELKKTMSDNKIQHQAEMADAVALAEARVVQIKSDLDTSLLQLSSHVENVSALEHQITMLHQQVHTLEQQLKDQVLTIQALNDKNDMQIADFELATEQQVAYHKEELSELTASMHKQAKEDALALQRAIQERDDAISSLAPNSELQLSIASKDMELQQQAARTIELENQVQELQLQILNQNQTLAEMKNGPSQLGDPEWLEALIQVLLMARTAHSGLNLDAAAPALMHDSISLQLRESLSSIWEYIAELRDSLDSQYKLLNDTTTQFEQERSELQHSIVQHQERASELSNQVDQVQPMLVQQQALAQQLADENEQLYGERTLLMDKLTSMKNAIGPKLQAEMDECHRLRGDLAAAQEHSTSLQVQIQSLTDAIHLAENDSTTALTDTSRLQSELTEARDHAERQQTELERLRQFLVELEDSQTQDTLTMQTKIEEYRCQVESLEKEQEQWVQAADETRTARHQADAATAEAREELALMVQKVDTLTAKVEQGQISQINLQRVLEQFEASKDSEITFAVDAVTRKLMEANAAIDGFRERADRAETQLAELTIQLKSGSNMEKDLQERNALVGKLRHDLVQVQTHLAEAMRRMRNGGADASVDRKLIANLLVSLLSSPRGDSKRFEILGLIANILRFENDEKVKVGLLRRHPDMSDGSVKPHTETVMGASETFMDMWIGFLVNESNSKSGTAQSPNQQDSSISPLLQSTLSPRLSVSSERGQPLIPHPLSTGTGFGSSTPSLSIPSSPLTPTASSTGNGKQVKQREGLSRFLPSSADFHFRGSRCYLRPYFDALLDFLAQNKQITFAVWTSAQRENAIGLTKFAFGDLDPQVNFIWDRTYCDHAPMGQTSHATIKDLSRIWNSNSTNPDGIWSEKNTILVDDSPHKFRESPQNALQIPTFTFETRKLPKLVNPTNDTALVSLMLWLKLLPFRKSDDIRDIINEFPLFSMGSDLHTNIGCHNVDQTANPGVNQSTLLHQHETQSEVVESPVHTIKADPECMICLPECDPHRIEGLLNSLPKLNKPRAWQTERFRW